MPGNWNDELHRVFGVSSNGEWHWNKHPRDWERFYRFIDQAQRAGGWDVRPDIDDIRNYILSQVPRAASDADEVTLFYEHAINMLDHLRGFDPITNRGPAR